MKLNWSALGEVALVSIGVTVGVVLVFAIGVRALAVPDGAPTGPQGTATGRHGGASPGPASRAVSGLCFLACAAVVAYGIYLIVPQFH
ncbi:hypothetical protein ABT160_05140 [Streptomyces sp. NPDC001941]|uniref:hypothetical protein n=1 Tax=Streptomyces sp. NPDC001941 TaxID=3154659 RepID=UPI0033323A5B